MSLEIKVATTIIDILAAKKIVESEWPHKDKVPDADLIFGYDLLSDNNIQVYLGYINHKPVCTATLYIIPTFRRNFSDFAQIENVVTLLSHRGNGYGKMMIEYLVDIAKKNSCYKIVLNCGGDIMPFYKGCGFYWKEYQMRLDQE
jgi:GNAT superfamily N-acetyltransferase